MEGSIIADMPIGCQINEPE